MMPAVRAPSHPAAFPLRGLKGLWWEPRQYLPWPPVLEAAGYNFFLLCYTFCAEASLRWRHPLDRTARDVIAQLAGDCGRRASVLGLADLAEAQCRVVSALWTRLQAIDRRVRLLVVPTLYWTGGLRAHPLYTTRLAVGLPPGVDVFWTGEEVRSQAITRAQAAEANVLYGRQPVLWLNYASNDSFRFSLQLPPAPPPAADLSLAVGGLIVNPMRQVALSQLHALVMGEYLRDPPSYTHAGALKRACVGLLLSALRVRDPELDEVDASMARDKLLSRLGEVDDEIAADARLGLN